MLFPVGVQTPPWLWELKASEREDLMELLNENRGVM